jgi:hypothetical protein
MFAIDHCRSVYERLSMRESVLGWRIALFKDGPLVDTPFANVALNNVSEKSPPRCIEGLRIEVSGGWGNAFVVAARRPVEDHASRRQ